MRKGIVTLVGMFGVAVTVWLSFATNNALFLIPLGLFFLGTIMHSSIMLDNNVTDNI